MDILIYIIGGILAGVATGLIGLSAAVVIAPLFATVFGMDPYVAVGIALASDVFASAISSVTYIKNKNIDIKHSNVLAITIITFAIIGSLLSKDMDPNNMNSILNIFVVLLGIRFLVYPVKDPKPASFKKFGTFVILTSLFFGAIIGMISGYFGGGGGLSILAVLVMLYAYDIKKAVGTSVFIMTFTALVGASTHIIMRGTFWIPLLITSAAAMFGANLASRYANKINTKTLNRVIGIFLVVYGIILLILHFSG